MTLVGPLTTIISSTTIIACLALLIYVCCRTLISYRLPMVLAGCFLLSAAAVADQRNQWARIAYSGTLPDGLASFISDARRIYWEQGLDLLWFGLHYPSYYSCVQRTGAMFYRDVANEYSRRSAGLHVLNTTDFADDDDGLCYPKEKLDEFGPTNRGQMAKACRELPDLELIVLTRKVPGTPYRSWQAPASLPLYQNNAWNYYNTFYAYDCAVLR